VIPLLRQLGSHRRRIRLARAAEAAARGGFTASIAVCALLAVSRVAGFDVPAAVAWGAIAGAALGFGLREAGRSFTLRDCAISLDRLLGLEERLSTAVENAGAMRDAQAADAAEALSRATVPPWRLPREAKLLAGSALLAAALLVIHAPANAGGTDDPALVAVTDEVASKLDALAPEQAEFKEVRELLKQKGRLEEAAAKLQALADQLDRKILEGKGGAEARAQRDAAAAGAAAISAELARMGRPVAAAPPTVVALKLERQRLETAPPPFSTDEDVVRSVATTLERADWAPRYDAVIRRYYGSDLR
jgi:hypothetical protein